MTLIAFETERETESESSKNYEVRFGPKFCERGGDVFRPVRNFLHVYIDKVYVVVLFTSMPVTLIASETEREIERARAANFMKCVLIETERETRSESSKFYEIHFYPKVFKRGAICAERVRKRQLTLTKFWKQLIC